MAMEDIESWWEVPSIAHFCSIFRVAFDLLDIEIEEFEEALIVDSTENETSLLDHLVTRLLSGCLESKEIALHNYDEFLRDYIVHRWRMEGKNADELLVTSFKFATLRCKVEILYSLCEYRLQAEDVSDSVKNLDGETLRMEPIGEDQTGAKYWYFNGLRLYREAADRSIVQSKQQRENAKMNENLQTHFDRGRPTNPFNEDKRLKAGSNKKSMRVGKSEERKGYCPKLAWSIVCRNENDWQRLADKFSKSKNMKENDLGVSLNDSLEEIKRIGVEREKVLRKRLIAMLPKRVSSRIEGIKKQERDATQTREIEQKALALEQERQERIREQNERRLQDMKRRGERVSERVLEKEGRKILRSRLKI